MNGERWWLFEGLLNAHQSDHFAKANPSAKNVSNLKGKNNKHPHGIRGVTIGVGFTSMRVWPKEVYATGAMYLCNSGVIHLHVGAQQIPKKINVKALNATLPIFQNYIYTH